MDETYGTQLSGEGLDPERVRRSARRAVVHGIRRDTNRMAWAACAMYLAMNLVALVLQVFAVLFVPGPDVYGGTTADMYFLMQCAAAALGTPLAFFLFAVALRVDFSDYLRFEKAPFGRCLLYVGFGVLLCTLAQFPAAWLSDLVTQAGFNDVTQETPLPDSVLSSAAAVFGMAILPPLVEEFAFRGIVLSHLRRYGEKLAIAGSALIFALAHGNVVQIPFALIAGIALGIAYVKTNNLLVPMAIHALNNGMAVAMELAQAWAGDDAAIVTGNALMLLYLLLGTAATVVLLVMTIRGSDVMHMEKRPLPAGFGRRLGAMLTNPGMMALLVLSALNSVLMLFLL